jgi:D-alanyl-D-alanine carboxypeptidase
MLDSTPFSSPNRLEQDAVLAGKNAPDWLRLFNAASRNPSLLATPTDRLFSAGGIAADDILQTTPAPTALHGSEGSDRLIGTGKRKNVLFGNDGNNFIQGGNRRDLLNGGADDDRLTGNRADDQLVGGSGDDRLTGDKGNDSLKGLSGNDRLNGGEGNDQLDGGTGFDQVNGGKGNDVLIDDGGGDLLTGGQGSDQFGVGSPLATEATRITDFEVGTDQIKVLRLGATFADLTLENRKGETIVLDQDEAIAILSHVEASRLQQSSFVFGNARLADTLQQNLERLLTDNPETTGISSTVTAPDGTVWVGTAGFSNLETQRSLEARDLFGAGSITKPLIATVVLQLQQEGKLSLEDTLSQWLPRIASQIPNSNRITIRQLLNHTSGIRNYAIEPELFEQFNRDPTILSRTFTNQDLLAVIAGKPALFEPGEGYAYGNTGYLLLGEIIEKATGSTVASQLRERIFEPLGMDDTYYAVQEQVKGNLTRSYQDLDGDGKLDDLNENLSWTTSAGGVVSTATDLSKFAQALFQGDLLAPETLQTMLTDGSPINLDNPLGLTQYTLGVVSGQSNVGRIVGHDGSTAGWASQMYYLPDHKITAVVMTAAPDSLSSEISVAQSLKETAQPHSVSEFRKLDRGLE